MTRSIRYTEDNWQAVLDWAECLGSREDFLGSLEIDTPQGVVRVEVGEWVTRQADGTLTVSATEPAS